MTELEIAEFIREKNKEGLGDSRIAKLLGVGRGKIAYIREKHNISGVKEVCILGNKVRMWTVVSESDRKYHYNCECECGNIKIFSKGNILNNNVSNCEVCEKNKLLDNSFEEFNRFYINAGNESLDRETIDITSEYRLVCEKGHKFNANLKKYNGCLKCKSVENKHINAKNSVEEFNIYKNKLMCSMKELLSEYYSNIKTYDEFPINVSLNGEEHITIPDIIIEDIMLNIEIYGIHHSRFNPKFHTSRSEFIKDKLIQEQKKKKLESKGYYQMEFIITYDINVDIARFKEILGRLIYI